MQRERPTAPIGSSEARRRMASHGVGGVSYSVKDSIQSWEGVHVCSGASPQKKTTGASEPFSNQEKTCSVTSPEERRVVSFASVGHRALALLQTHHPGSENPPEPRECLTCEEAVDALSRPVR